MSVETAIPIRSLIPDPPPTFDAQAWRLKLAGLTDPDYSAGEDNDAAARHKGASIELCLCLCELFGESLDRLTLWDRIASALTAAVSKCDDGDTDRLLTLCLEHVKADAGKVARHLGFVALMTNTGAESAAWRQGWVRWIASHSYALLGHARLAWEKFKDGKAADREAAKASEGFGVA